MGLINKSKLLFWRIFPPESQVEIFLRTVYHRITTTKIYINWQIKSARKSYQRWLEISQLKQLDINNPSISPKVTFVININPENRNLIAITINSIKQQITGSWNVVLTSLNGNTNNKNYQTIIQNDSRFMEVLQSTTNLSSLLSNCKSQYVIFCNAGDEFFQSFLYHFGHKYNELPDAAVYYSDMESLTNGDLVASPFFKPGQISPELLLSTNYLSRSIIKKEYAAQLVDEVDPSLDFFDQEWNLLLLISKNLGSIIHIPNVTIRLCETGYKGEKEETKTNFFFRYSNSKFLSSSQPPNDHFRDYEANPSISIIIPTRNNLLTIKTLLVSIFELTEYPNYEIILVDNGSTDENVLSYYQDLTKSQKLKIIQYENMFNYSQALNLGASHSSSDLFLFLNNDMQVINPDWLSELAKWTMIPEVGIVGTKLLHPNHSIQHAGIIIGLQGIVGHINLNLDEHFYGFTGSVDWTRNYCAVTGACQMMRRDVFYELSGYDENFQLVMSDIELCLRATERGYRIVYAPSAALIHYEGKSRGYKTPLQDLLLGYKKMQKWLEKDDPYYSPNLTYSPIPKCQIDGDSINNRLTRINNRKKSIERVLKT